MGAVTLNNKIAVKGIDIPITEEEFYKAAMVGVKRCKRAYMVGKKDNFVDGSEYDSHIRGALAEFAVAKWADVKWTGKIDNYQKEADFNIDDYNITVKCSNNVKNILRNGMRMKKSNGKRANDIFIYTYCDINEPGDIIPVKLIGWISGKEAMRFSRLNEPFWHVPATELNGFLQRAGQIVFE